MTKIFVCWFCKQELTSFDELSTHIFAELMMKLKQKFFCKHEYVNNFCINCGKVIKKMM